MESSTGKWSNLPNDLVEHIVKLLDSPIDLIRFRSVCTKWRTSFPLIKNMNPLFPLKVPTPTCIDPDLRPFSVFLIESTIYKISNTSKNTNKSWLVRVEGSSTKKGKVHLKDPLTPSLFRSSSTKKFPKIWNLLNLRISEVSKAYELKIVSDHQLWTRTSMIKKVVASKKSDNFAIMALHRRGKLGVWRMREKKWNQIEDNVDDHEWSKYIDIAYHNEKFYAVDIKGLTISIDCAQKITHIAPTKVCSGFEYYDDRGRYLVNSNGCLLLVDNPPIRGCNVHFNIYKLNEDEGSWVPVDSLGDQVLFLGDDCSLSVSARDFEGCRGNCIYFTVYGYTVYDAYPGYHSWLFDMDDHSVHPLSPLTRFRNPFRPPSNWLKSKKKLLAFCLEANNVMEP